MQRTASRTGWTATSTTRLPGRQSGSRATSPAGDTSAASPGKSSSSVGPAWVAMATGTPSRRAWRAASPSPADSHQACPSRQPRSSVRRPCSPGAEQRNSTAAPPVTASVQGKSTSASAQRVTPNRADPSSNTPVPVPAW
jgi:hypothetical protein